MIFVIWTHLIVTTVPILLGIPNNIIDYSKLKKIWGKKNRKDMFQITYLDGFWNFNWKTNVIKISNNHIIL